MTARAFSVASPPSSSSDYEQKLDDRTARIDIGSAVGIRGGITIKF